MAQPSSSSRLTDFFDLQEKYQAGFSPNLWTIVFAEPTCPHYGVPPDEAHCGLDLQFRQERLAYASVIFCKFSKYDEPPNSSEWGKVLATTIIAWVQPCWSNWETNTFEGLKLYCSVQNEAPSIAVRPTKSVGWLGDEGQTRKKNFRSKERPLSQGTAATEHNENADKLTFEILSGTIELLCKAEKKTKTIEILRVGRLKI